MGNIIDIEIVYNGTDVAAANPMSDSRIRERDQAAITAKFNSISGILQQHDVQPMQIVDITKTMRAKADEATLDALNTDLAPLNFKAVIPTPMDWSNMLD